MVFDASVASAAFTLGGLSGNGNVALQNNAATPAPVTLTVGNNNGTTLFSGTLTGAGSLAKTGLGTLELTGGEAFGGSVTVVGGTLQIGNGSANSQLVAGTYTVHSGARLYLDYATAVPGGSGTWSSQITGKGTLELNCAQAVNGAGQWAPSSSTATMFGSGFTGTLQLDNGQLDSTPAALGGVTGIIVGANAQFAPVISTSGAGQRPQFDDFTFFDRGLDVFDGRRRHRDPGIRGLSASAAPRWTSI